MCRGGQMCFVTLEIATCKGIPSEANRRCVSATGRPWKLFMGWLLVWFNGENCITAVRKCYANSGVIHQRNLLFWVLRNITKSLTPTYSPIVQQVNVLVWQVYSSLIPWSHPYQVTSMVYKDQQKKNTHKYIFITMYLFPIKIPINVLIPKGEYIR